jgi:hypothetical protein
MVFSGGSALRGYKWEDLLDWVINPVPEVKLGNIFEKVILKIVLRHTERENLLNASQFRFHANHSKKL